MNDPQPPPPSGGPAATDAPPVDAPSPATPPPDGGFFGAVRRLRVERSDDRWVAGVCSGVADRLGVDPLVVRGIVGLAFLLGGAGAVAYGLAWALLPERRDGRIHLEETIAGRFDVAIVGAAALVVLGAGRGSDGWNGGIGPQWFGHVLDAIGGMLWFGFVASLVVLAVVLVTRAQRDRPPRPSTPYGQPPYGQPPYGQPPYGRPAAAQHDERATAPLPPYGAAPTGPTAQPAAAPSASVWTHHGRTTYARAPYTPAGAPPAGPRPPTATATVPDPTPTPKPAAKPRTRGPGAASLGTVVALGLLTLAALLAASRTGAFDGPVLLTALGVTAVLAGLGVVVAGLRGRTSGSLGFLAIAALVVALPLGAVSDSGWMRDEGTRWGSSTVTVTTRDAAAEGLQVGAGETTFDLTDVPLTGSTLTVPVSVGAGRVTVVVPQDAAVAAEVRVGLGSATWEVGDSSEQVGGAGIEHHTFEDQASSDGTAQLMLDISVGIGDVTVTREDA